MQDNYDISKLKRKKKKNSKKKGSTFENDIAKIFNERLGTKDFARTPGSGAFATTHSLPEHLKIHGDLISPLNFKFCIECKKGYPKENLYSLYNDSSEFWGFLKQSQKDADKSKKVNMVIFKQDYRPTLAIIPTWVETSKVTKFIICNIDGKEYRICLFDEILQEPDEFFMS
jgi:Holliday junction resolvase